MDGNCRKEESSRIIEFTTRLHDALRGLNAAEAEKQLQQFGDELRSRIERVFQIDSACIAGLDQASSAYVTDDVRDSILGSLKLAADAQPYHGYGVHQVDRRLQSIARINAAWGGTIFKDYQFEDLGRPTAQLLARVARAYPHWRYAVQRINVAMLSRHITNIRRGTGLMIGHHHSTSKVKQPHKPIEPNDLKLVLKWKEDGEIEFDGTCLPDVGSDIPPQLQSVVNEWSISEDVPLDPDDCVTSFSTFHLLVKDLHQLLVPRPQEEVNREKDSVPKPTGSTATPNATNNTTKNHSQSHLGLTSNSCATPPTEDLSDLSSCEGSEESQGGEHPVPGAGQPSSPRNMPNDSKKRRRTTGEKAGSSMKKPTPKHRNRRSSRYVRSSDDSDGVPDTPTSPPRPTPTPLDDGDDFSDGVPHTPTSPPSSTSSNRSTPTPPDDGDDFSGLIHSNPGHTIDDYDRPTTSGKMPMLRLAEQNGRSSLFVHDSEDSDGGLDMPTDGSESPPDPGRFSPKLPTPRTSPGIDPFTASMQHLLGGDVGQCAEHTTGSQALQSPEGTSEVDLTESFFDDAFGTTMHDAFNEDVQRSPDLDSLSQACRVINDIFTVGGFRPISETRAAKILYHPRQSTSCEPDEAEVQCLTYDVLETWAGSKVEVTLPTIVQDPETARSPEVRKADLKLTDVTHTRTVRHGNNWLRNSQGTHLCVVAPMSMLGVHPGSAVFLEQGDILIVPYGTYCNAVTFDSGVLQEGVVSSRPSDRPFTADRLLLGLKNIKSFPEFLILAE